MKAALLRGALAGWLSLAAHGAPAAATCSVPEEITSSLTLDGTCEYRQSVRITRSHVVLDCAGATFNGEGTRKVGVTVDSAGGEVHHVTVRNCRFVNQRASGVFVTWDRKDAEKSRISDEERAARTPHHVTLTHLEVSGSGRVGVYFDDFVRDSTLSHSLIEGSGAPAVYLEFGSRRISIEHNTFRRNGYGVDGAARREAVAVDASADNRIHHNHFISNGLGGVFLYKNCGERLRKKGWVPRTQHSDRNQITANRFTDERIGIWIASRQSRDLGSWDCSDRPMDPGGRYFEDFANDNSVSGNVFCGSGVGIIIEGDRNRVATNSFDPVASAPVVLPRSRREEFLRRPASGNAVMPARFDASACASPR